VGVLLGFVTTAVFSDRVISWQSARSTNTYIEAEVRLPLAIPGLFLATTGLWTFWFCANNPSSLMWVGMQFGLGMLSFGLVLVPSIGFNYVCLVSTPSALPSRKMPSFPLPTILYILSPTNHTQPPTDHRSLRPPGPRRIRYHRHATGDNQLLLDFLCGALGYRCWYSSPVWGFWCDNGSVFFALGSGSAFWEADADCDGEVGSLIAEGCPKDSPRSVLSNRNN
jgi:hypothetical protein